mmetsp:Transcript_23557/g.50110  ORF Transcript_23557/g.50110 Transcript_23557/m.50110 type:complete len:280 (+) Transcript_23557:177-1016(+)|eukprot:CAMPEP_0201120992 /NCGR_PEP_ID=MMETSP0850-20130426/4954_1 /ASSEMBLY_ACC=CAM_ASM_000622 /TAXON_ID=183588 /ORGANISM="Pseudo-nitzschia fraudulenta, Strain WWA7" /LENGTH=279 /DNA_ID=CAMNT_0047387305 /DNA_START=192 /DNA_END=1031 /DNA_ORIENTATION=+
MSDLAPFVAAVLKDHAVADMMAEIKQLRGLVDERLCVQVTGERGFPVYHEASLRDGYTSHRGRCFEVMFDCHDDDKSSSSSRGSDEPENQHSSNSQRGSIPLTALLELEIRLGGVVIQRFDARTLIGSCNAPFFTKNDFYRDTKYNKDRYFSPDRKEVVLMAEGQQSGWDPVPFVIARFGNEMDASDYKTLHRVGTGELLNLYATGKAATVVIDGLTFRKPQIEKALVVLETMGYNKPCNYTSSSIHNRFHDSVKKTPLVAKYPPPVARDNGSQPMSMA